MRGLFILCVLALALCLPIVSAMGLLVPPGLDGGISLDDDSQDIQITVVNDDVRNRVDFFVEPVESGYVTMNGKDLFTQSFSLDPHESKVVEFELQGTHDIDELRVQYGFTYKPYNVDDDFGIEQTVSSYFTVEVEDCCIENFNVVVNGDDATNDGSVDSSAPSGSSGVSGGGVVPPSPSDSADSSDSSDGSDVEMQDVDGQTTSLTQGIVDDKQKVVDSSSPTNIVDVQDGKLACVFFLVMLMISMAVQVAAINKVKNGGEL
jgi:hypothetical protein